MWKTKTPEQNPEPRNQQTITLTPHWQVDWPLASPQQGSPQPVTLRPLHQIHYPLVSPHLIPPSASADPDREQSFWRHRLGRAMIDGVTGSITLDDSVSGVGSSPLRLAMARRGMQRCRVAGGSGQEEDGEDEGVGWGRRGGRGGVTGYSRSE